MDVLQDPFGSDAVLVSKPRYFPNLQKVLRPGHRGQTPPLFVGLRGLETIHVPHSCAVYVDQMPVGENGTEIGTETGDLDVGFIVAFPDAPTQLEHNKAPVFFGQGRGQRTPEESANTGTEQLQQAKPERGLELELELEEVEPEKEAAVEMPSENLTPRKLETLLPKNAVKGLWFFSLYGQKEDIDSLLHRLREAGVKLASDVARPPWRCVKCECGSIYGPNTI